MLPLMINICMFSSRGCRKMVWSSAHKNVSSTTHSLISLTSALVLQASIHFPHKLMLFPNFPAPPPHELHQFLSLINFYHCLLHLLCNLCASCKPIQTLTRDASSIDSFNSTLLAHLAPTALYPSHMTPPTWVSAPSWKSSTLAGGLPYLQPALWKSKHIAPLILNSWLLTWPCDIFNFPLKDVHTVLPLTKSPLCTLGPAVLTAGPPANNSIYQPVFGQYLSPHGIRKYSCKWSFMGPYHLCGLP